MNEDELKKISRENKPKYINQKFINNNLYAAEYILKRYSEVDLSYELKIAIEHGVFRTIMVPEFIVDAPTIFVYSKFRYDYLSRYTKQKLIYPIGGIIQYANLTLNNKELENEKKRLGRNLLAFPKHGIRLISTKFDIEEYCKVLKSFENEFDTIRVCLYYDDINNNIHKIYQKFGFEIVTAGNTYNIDFFDRLKTIISTATITTSNYAGGPLGNCIMLDKPHFITPQKIELLYNNDQSCWNEYYQNQFKTFRYSMDKILFDNFTKKLEIITEKQNKIVTYYWGKGLKKTKEEMRLLFNISEIIFSKNKSYFLFNENFIEETRKDLKNMINILDNTLKKRKIVRSKSLKRKISLIPSHLTPIEKLTLYTLLKKIPLNSVYLETGSFMGASAAIAGLALKNRNTKIYCIDDWNRHNKSIKSYEAFLKNTFEFKDSIISMNGNINQIIKNLNIQIDFLFIDGLHNSIEEVKEELEPCLPLLKENAIVAIHHYYWSDSVKSVVSKYIDPMAIEYYSLPNMWIAKITKKELISSFKLNLSKTHSIQLLEELKNHKFSDFNVIIPKDYTYISHVVKESKKSKSNRIIFENKEVIIKIFKREDINC